MYRFSQPTPDGRTIPADPDLGRHIAQPPPRHPAARAAERAAGSALTAFVAGSIAALPETPRGAGLRLCLKVFLIGAAEAFWRRHRLPAAGMIQVLSRLLERYELPGNDTPALVESLAQLRQDAAAREILEDGARAMAAFLGSHDPNLALQMQERVADWRRNGLCRDGRLPGRVSPRA